MKQSWLSWKLRTPKRIRLINCWFAWSAHQLITVNNSWCWFLGPLNLVVRPLLKRKRCQSSSCTKITRATRTMLHIACVASQSQHPKRIQNIFCTCPLFQVLTLTWVCLGTMGTPKATEEEVASSSGTPPASVPRANLNTQVVPSRPRATAAKAKSAPSKVDPEQGKPTSRVVPKAKSAPATLPTPPSKRCRGKTASAEPQAEVSMAEELKKLKKVPNVFGGLVGG